MIISKTPFRISFLGGGTDFPAYYKYNPGKVVGMTIDKYCYIFFRHGNNLMDYNFRVAYSKIEMTKRIDKIGHISVKNTSKFFNHKKSFDILHAGDLPAKSGLGSSSSFTVGLVNIFRKINKFNLNRKNLANDALEIEQNLSKENVGSQDQIFAAYGGFNVINFKGKKYSVEKLNLKNKKKIANLDKNIKHLEKIYKYTIIGENILKSKNIDIKEFGNLIHEAWNEKKKLDSSVSNNFIDDIYNTAVEAGAYGGKLLGAGGGGFLCFIADKKYHNRIFQKLKPLKIIKTGLSEEGSKIIVNYKNEYLKY